MTLKDLNKLARACRKLGIAHLKTDEVEIHLSAEIVPATRKPRAKSAPVNESIFNEGNQPGISDTDLLFWSSTESTQ